MCVYVIAFSRNDVIAMRFVCLSPDFLILNKHIVKPIVFLMR